MERNVVEIFKQIEEEQLSKAEALKKEFDAKMHEVAEEHQQKVTELVEGLTDEEFVTLVKSDDLSMADKTIVTIIYSSRKNA